MKAALAPRRPACTGARMRRVTRRMTSFYEQHLRAAGLRLSQYSVLSALSARPQSLLALADRLELDRTTLTRNLQPLVAAGWVEAARGPDARQKLFVLTAAGSRRRAAARAAWKTAQAELEAQLGPAFIANLHAQLDHALALLKPALPDDN